MMKRYIDRVCIELLKRVNELERASEVVDDESVSIRIIMCCVDCVYRLKPTGGTNNDPNSLCKKTLKTNYVTGNIDMVKCEIVNKTGSCFYFKKR